MRCLIHLLQTQEWDLHVEWLWSEPVATCGCADSYQKILLIADDLVLLAPSPQMLQRQLNQLHQFCLAKGMEVNVARTEVVVFRHPKYPGKGGAWKW
jgi:hypothetical protein